MSPTKGFGTSRSPIDGLRGKSRHRREALAQSHGVDRAPRVRNDLLPKLELVERPIADLRPPTRNVRHEHPAHIREIATRS